MDIQEYRCPLCQSLLPREKWIKITGQWEENKKILEISKKQIEAAKKNLEAEKKKLSLLEKRRMIDMKKATRLGEQAGISKGKNIEKKEREKMTKMMEKQTKDISASHEKIKQLQEQLKKGITPQTAGFDYEKEVQKMLSETFVDDEIKCTGKMGDVLHNVIIEENAIGKILYECKKTDKFSNDFIKEISRHQEDAHANYAVIVTHAPKKDKSKFFLEGEVIIIDPLGLMDLAFFLRTTLIEMHKMKLTREEVKQKGIEILRYMQAGDFKAHMVGNIDQAKKAYRLLMKEVDDHKKTWEERVKIYYTIHKNTQSVRKAIGQILTGKQFEESELESFPIETESIPLLETGKIVK